MVPANANAPRANGGQCDTTGGECAADATPQPDATQAAQHPKDSRISKAQLNARKRLWRSHLSSDERKVHQSMCRRHGWARGTYFAATLKQLSEATDLNRYRVQHCLRRLTAHGLLVVVLQGTKFTPTGWRVASPPPEAPDDIDAVRGFAERYFDGVSSKAVVRKRAIDAGFTSEYITTMFKLSLQHGIARQRRIRRDRGLGRPRHILELAVPQ